MPGNSIGGAKAAAKNKANDPDFYRKLGAMPHPRGGFKGRPDLAREAGRKGGTISRKDKSKVKTAQMGDKLYIMNGSDPLRYVDLTKNKVKQYKPKAAFTISYKYKPAPTPENDILVPIKKHWWNR